jgi:RNA polymerase subunit RPABC4/transcription elongation factor Spt4
MNRTSHEGFDIREEVKVIPAWAIVLAVGFFVGVQALLHLVIFPRDLHAPPLVLRAVFGLIPACVLAFFTLLVGYVNRDTKRRGMNRTLWTILVIFVPNAIGFIIYFLMRQPVQATCPQCAATVNPAFNYCPRCKFNLHPACPQCHRTIEAGDTFCPYCASELKAPA